MQAERLGRRFDVHQGAVDGEQAEVGVEVDGGTFDELAGRFDLIVNIRGGEVLGVSGQDCVLGRQRGSPKCGSTPVSKRVMAQILVSLNVSTMRPLPWLTPSAPRR